MFFSRKTMRYILLCSMTVPFLPFVLPKNIVTRFLSIGDMADSSTLYRFYTWKGSLAMIRDNLWGGIGYGADSFAQLYPMYAYSGIETAAHSHSLYLQILIGMGLGGLICFFALIVFYSFLYVSNRYEYERELRKIEKLTKRRDNLKNNVLTLKSEYTSKSRQTELEKILRTRESELQTMTKPMYSIKK